VSAKPFRSVDGNYFPAGSGRVRTQRSHSPTIAVDRISELSHLQAVGNIEHSHFKYCGTKKIHDAD